MQAKKKKSNNPLNFFFTNLDKNIFILKNMPEVLKGALLSRYSRSSKPLRQLFLEEYLNSTELNIQKTQKNLDFNADNLTNTEKAKNFYRKWLAMYGDDSIAELGGIHIGIENISVLATKSIEDRRIGISPLEKSTRYVRYDDKENGKYKYYVGKDIQESGFYKEYVKTMDILFDTYSNLMEPMMEYFRKTYPKPDTITDNAYNTSIRAKSCDTLRGLLPLATLTNMGIFANGRAIEYCLTRLYADPLFEATEIGADMHVEVKKIMENFVERIDSEKGSQYIDYLKKTQNLLEKNGKKYVSKIKNEPGKTSVILLDYDRDALNKIITSILYTTIKGSYKDLKKHVLGLSVDNKNKILNDYVKLRGGRWHKVGKAFEETYYTFEIVSDIGAYKDLQRHRMTSIHKQLFGTELGYEIPEDVISAGYKKDYDNAMEASNMLYKKIKKSNPTIAQYIACHGNFCRWRVKLNLREVFHLCELRSSPQGHPSYRKIAQKIYLLVKKVQPDIGNTIKFVNLSEPGLERLSAEVRKEKKLDQLGML